MSGAAREHLPGVRHGRAGADGGRPRLHGLDDVEGLVSASEKLKALRMQPIVYTDGDFKFRDGFSEESLRPLLAALPQIVAVVEEAETDVIGGELPHLAAALAALDEALP
jgi:hypothetical protein